MNIWKIIYVWTEQLYTHPEQQFNYVIFRILTCILCHLQVYYELTMQSAHSWLDSSLSVGGALHWYHRGHGFESRSNLFFFLDHWDYHDVFRTHFLSNLTHLVGGLQSCQTRTVYLFVILLIIVKKTTAFVSCIWISHSIERKRACKSVWEILRKSLHESYQILV